MNVSERLNHMLKYYDGIVHTMGSFVLIDSEQTYSKLPFMFSLIWCRSKGVDQETILIEEVLNDEIVLGKMKESNNTDRTSRMKMFLSVIAGETPHRKMKYRDFLNYVFRRCANGGPIPMISHSRDNDLYCMYKLDQYLPGDKFFNSDPRKNPIECSYNKTWKNFIPQVCSMLVFSQLCPSFYSLSFNPYQDPTRKEKDGPHTMSSVMRRLHPDHVPTHRSDTDVEDLFEALMTARRMDVFEIPRTNYMVMYPPSKPKEVENIFEQKKCLFVV